MNLLKLDPNLKSLPSPSAYLYIENGTDVTVDIYWIDFHSRLIRLTTLKPYKGTPINTYALHPWIFIDHATGQLLNVKNRAVLYGTSLRKREKEFVHLPMKSLQDITLLCLFKHLKSVDAVEELEIPQTLKHEVRHVFLIFEDNKKRLREQPER